VDFNKYKSKELKLLENLHRIKKNPKQGQELGYVNYTLNDNFLNNGVP